MAGLSTPNKIVSGSELICSSVFDVQCGPIHRRENGGSRSPQPHRYAFAESSQIDDTKAVLRVVPIHKRGNPEAGFLHAAEWPVGVVRPVFNGAK